MGTSTFHRSPTTPEWERVKELYGQPNPSPGEIASRVTSALDSQVKAGLADLAVTTCLDALLHAASSVASHGMAPLLAQLSAKSEYPALELAGGLRSVAEARICASGASSMFAEFGLAALSKSALDACGGIVSAASADRAAIESSFGGWGSPDRLGALTLSFVGHEMEQAYRYFVSRDISDFVGSSALMLPVDRNRLVADVGRHCMHTAGSLRLPELDVRAYRTITLEGEQRLGSLQPLLSEAIEAGLAALAVGG